jgi:L-ascorbate metabolism protein UlaG (beta-lactamase superfamily)
VSRLAVTWWGHASTTVELGGARIATDPLLADRLYHLRRHGSRPLAAATEADLVLVSHLHADHLHRPSLHRFGAQVPLVVPRGAEDLLAGRVLHPVEPGDVVELAGVRVEVLAAVHDGRRAPGSRHRGPALGFRVSGADGSFWFPGDTGPGVDLGPVGPVDLALVPVGGWGPTLGEEHLDPGQAAAAVARVGARWAVPVHWGTFWPRGLERLDRRTHHRLFVTPGARFAEALGIDAPATEAVAAVPGERVVR